MTALFSPSSVSRLLRVSFSPLLTRAYASDTKPSVALLSRLRKQTEVSITKGREALIATGNDYEAAVKWIQEDSLKSGEKKAAKLGERVAGEGVVATVVTGGEAGWGSKMAMVELCCETDFVSRNENFKAFAGRIANAALTLEKDVATSFQPIPIDKVLSAPLLPTATVGAHQTGNASTVKEGVIELIGKLGENMNVRRFAVAGTDVAGANASQSPAAETLIGTYAHGGETSTYGTTFVNTGSIGGAVLLGIEPSGSASLTSEKRATIGAFARSLARQVVGFKPAYLDESHVPAGSVSSVASDRDAWLSENVLLRQQLLGGQDGETVSQAIDRIGNAAGPARIRILDFLRYEAGEGIERPETDFADEVKKAGGMI